MNYEQIKALVEASGTLEGISPTIIADGLNWAIDAGDGHVAAVAAYELGRLRLDRLTFRHLAGVSA